MITDWHKEQEKWALVTGDKFFKLAGFAACWGLGSLAGAGAIPATIGWLLISASGWMFNEQEQIHQRRIGGLLLYAIGVSAGLTWCSYAPPQSYTMDAFGWLATALVAKEALQLGYAWFRGSAATAALRNSR